MSEQVLNQLQCTGMLDTLTIRKQGYPARPDHKAFYERFKPLFPAAMDHVELVDILRPRGAGFGEKDLIIGKTKVLLRDDTARILETERTLMMTKWAITVQCVYRGCVCAMQYQAMKNSYKAMRSELHAFVGRLQVANEKDNICVKEERGKMETYLRNIQGELDSEHYERTCAALEDDYAYKIWDATQAERFAKEKDEALQTAMAEYEQYRSTVEMYKEKITKMQQDAENKEVQIMQEGTAAIKQGRAAALRYTGLVPEYELRGGEYESQAKLPYRKKFKITRGRNPKSHRNCYITSNSDF